MANRFVLNTISYHGSGAIKEIPGELQRRGYKKIFVCSDPDLVKFGVPSKVTAELDAAAAEKIARDEKGFAGISKILDALYARLSERLAAAKSGVLPLPEADFAAKTPNEKFREFASLYARAAAADRAYSDDAGGVKTGVFLRASGAERRNGVARLKVRAPGKGGK